MASTDSEESEQLRRQGAVLMPPNGATAPTVETILAELNARGANIMGVVGRAEAPPYRELWVGDGGERLYCTAARRLIGAGRPARGYALAQDGQAHHPACAELRYWAALALARSGNVHKAGVLADALLEKSDLPGSLRVETLSLQGRLAKDRYGRETDPERRRTLAVEAASLYERAHALPGADAFPGINAATMYLLAGRIDSARELAQRVVDKVHAGWQAGQSRDYWSLATLGEASIILGDVASAQGWYQEAIGAAQGQVGDLASMRRNVQLLAPFVEGLEVLLESFGLGTVVVFSGHMIDHPNRPEPRFPPDPALDRAVAAEIGRALDDLNATIGYASVACGSDLLFQEALRARGAERHVVLPFHLEDFYYTSVDFGYPSRHSWRERCDVALAAATDVHYATHERFQDEASLFHWGNVIAQGLAANRAAQLGVPVCALAVVDTGEDGKPALTGGTPSFLEHWHATGWPVRIIELGALRRRVAPLVVARTTDTMETPAAQEAPVTSSTTARPVAIARQVKAMLFADVKNYSMLDEEQAPAFVATFIGEVARVIGGLAVPPDFQNTWGDGLYLVFPDVVSCADFALRLLDRVRLVDWPGMGLPADTTVRMGIHAGPVYPHYDAIIGRQNFFGAHVNRAARTEPVTTPGAAFTTEQYAAALAVHPAHDYACEFVGVEWLAKEYDRCALYRLVRRGPA
jgi:class 3 adenylate cyclase/tetratricopeptide (TPR) repeat protein